MKPSPATTPSVHIGPSPPSKLVRCRLVDILDVLNFLRASGIVGPLAAEQDLVFDPIVLSTGTTGENMVADHVGH